MVICSDFFASDAFILFHASANLKRWGESDEFAFYLVYLLFYYPRLVTRIAFQTFVRNMFAWQNIPLIVPNILTF